MTRTRAAMLVVAGLMVAGLPMLAAGADEGEAGAAVPVETHSPSIICVGHPPMGVCI